LICFYLKNNTSMGDTQQDEDSDEIKKISSKKKRKEIDLPITSRVPGATKIELDRLIEQEVREDLNKNKLMSLFLIE